LTITGASLTLRSVYLKWNADVSSRERGYRQPRRRGFDDDNHEPPPTRNFGYAPPRGPQFDSPSGPIVRATVKWYNPDKGFGFVELASGEDAFLHVSVVERGGHASVPPGATLEVRAGPGPKGPQVTEIVSLDASTASQEPPRRPRPERSLYPSGDRPTSEELGTVKWYNATKGFGFIAPDQGSKDIFVHASALERSSLMGLAEGQRVAVSVAAGQKGAEAVSVRLI
jgi:CspA family cold shock protein